MKPRKLTDAEVQALGEEYGKLMVQAELQIAEQRAFLERVIANDGLISDNVRNRLLQVLPDFKLVLCRVDDHNTLSQLQTTVVYDIPDELYAYLRGEQVPHSLESFLVGGVDITGKSKDVREDLAPKTGKKL